MKIKLVQLDGKLPNLALMKLAHWHKAQGDEVRLTRSIQPNLFDLFGGPVDRTYGSAIFNYSASRVRELRDAYPEAVIGGTGAGPLDFSVESYLGLDGYERYDYSLYPEYPWSLGFTQRGCRLNCGFCVVPTKEGRPKAINTIQDIYRPGTPRCVLLLDNDFFGQPRDQWRARLEELREGDFKVSFSQGINIRLVDDEAAQALAAVRYYDDQFQRRRLYTAWDNLGQESVFFRGMERLVEAGIPAKRLMVYMLIGYAPGETMEDIMHRFRKLVDAGCKPFPMVYDRSRADLLRFQRWVVRRYYQFIRWEDYHEAR